MRTWARLLVGGCLAWGAAGCADMSPPNFFNPGPARDQQMRAQRFDPYPENDVGPEVVGGRPLGYQKPIPEPSRARWQLKNPFARPPAHQRLR